MGVAHMLGLPGARPGLAGLGRGRPLPGPAGLRRFAERLARALAGA